MGTNSSGFVYTKKLEKHGTHDQSSHNPWKGSRGRGASAGTSVSSWSKDNNFRVDNQEDNTENQKIEKVYDDKYNKSTYQTEGQDKETLDSVETYAASGYDRMNSLSRGQTLPSAYDLEEIKKHNTNLDNAIANAPDIVSDKNLYRVYSDRVANNLEVGDVVIDKGFTSTTRVDITGSDRLARSTRERLGDISDSADTMAVIIPSPNKTGRGLIVDQFALSNGVPILTSGVSSELEVILPRNTALTFLGYKTIAESGKVLVFQRND